MSKHLTKECFYKLPSGTSVHPCRLILRDGTLMWKHALLSHNSFTSIPQTQAHEQHMIKTSQRLEELNTWVSQDLEPWESLNPIAWYDPTVPNLSDGISVYFNHRVHLVDFVYAQLKDHIQAHESLEIVELSPLYPALFFKRC